MRKKEERRRGGGGGGTELTEKVTKLSKSFYSKNQRMQTTEIYFVYIYIKNAKKTEKVEGI